jgi:hypothetical protein
MTVDQLKGLWRLQIKPAVLFKYEQIAARTKRICNGELADFCRGMARFVHSHDAVETNEARPS